jgi:hypothetical protein
MSLTGAGDISLLEPQLLASYRGRCGEAGLKELALMLRERNRNTKYPWQTGDKSMTFV